MVSRNPSNDLDHILHPKFSKIPENSRSPENTVFLCMDSQAMRPPGSDLPPSRPEATRLPAPTVWVVPFHAKQLDSLGHWPSGYLDGNIILLSVLHLGSWFTACHLPPWWGKAPHPREMGNGWTHHTQYWPGEDDGALLVACSHSPGKDASLTVHRKVAPGTEESSESFRKQVYQ